MIIMRKGKETVSCLAKDAVQTLEELCTDDGIDLRVEGADLSGLDMNNIRLDRAFFLRCNLSKANFTHSWAPGAEFNTCILDGCKFTDADMCGADLIGCRGTLADFTRTQLAGANIEYSQFQNTHFDDSKLAAVYIKCGHFHLCTFDRADMRYGHLVDSELKETSLFNADLRVSSFSGSSMDGNLDGTVFSDDMSAWNEELEHHLQEMGFKVRDAKVIGYRPEGSIHGSDVYVDGGLYKADYFPAFNCPHHLPGIYMWGMEGTSHAAYLAKLHGASPKIVTCWAWKRDVAWITASSTVRCRELHIGAQND